MAPTTAQRIAVLGLYFDGETGANEPDHAETAVQFLGQRLANEGGGVQLVGGRVEFCGDDPVRRRQAGPHGPLSQTPSQTMGQKAFSPEPPEHRGGRERREVPQRLQAQTNEQVSQAGEVTSTRHASRAAEAWKSEHPYGQRGQELGAPASWHYQRLAGRRLPCGQAGSKEAVSDADPAAAGPTTAADLATPADLASHYLLDRRRHLGRQRLVTAKISGRPTSSESQLAWLEHFGPRCERLDRCYSWLPPPSFGREVAGPDLQTGATGLSLPPAHTGPDASGPGGRRSRHHLVGRHDNHFAGGLEPSRDNSPIRAISNQGPGPAHPPSPGDAYVGRHLDRVALDQLEWRAAGTSSGVPNHIRALWGREAAPLPWATTSTSRPHRCPQPSSNPHQRPATMPSRTAAEPGQPSPITASTDPRSRALASSLRASEWFIWPAARKRTTSKPSSKAAVTVAHFGPGAGTIASRSRSIPSWLAATRPTSGAPTTAHQEPPAHGPLSNASANEVIPGESPRPITTVLPRRRPPSGKRLAMGAISWSRRSGAKRAPAPLFTQYLQPCFPEGPAAHGPSQQHSRDGNICSRASRAGVAPIRQPQRRQERPTRPPAPLQPRGRCRS